MDDYLFSLIASWLAYIRLAFNHTVTYKMTGDASEYGRTHEYDTEVQVYLIYMMSNTLVIAALMTLAYKLAISLDLYVAFKMLIPLGVVLLANVLISILYKRVSKQYIICMRTPELVIRFAIKSSHEVRIPNTLELFMDPLVLVMRRVENA